MQDSYRHRGLRQQLVAELKRKGVTDHRILDAFLQIPRHFFLDPTFDSWAYKDVAFPIEADQTISQPFTVATQTMLLEPKPKDKILEVGTGSGFQACVLAHLGAKVYTIERQADLFYKTQDLLEKIGFGNVRTLLGDGYKGLPRFTPFDKILVTAGATEIPIALVDQLKDGGLLVIPVGTGDNKKMITIRKMGSRLVKKEHGVFRFVPLLKGVESSLVSS